MSAQLDPGRDHFLAHQGLVALPDDVLKRCLEHLKAGGLMRAAYGWADDQSLADAGNPIGIALTRKQLEQAPDPDTLRWVAEEVFTEWALQYVDDAHTALPAPAVERLSALIRAELEARR